MSFSLFVLFAACTAPKDTGTDDSQGDSAEVDTAECTSDDACGDGRICEEETCVDGDRNNSVDEAEALLWSDPVTGTLNPANDVDYYVFTADGGEYVWISTTVDTDATPDANTFVTIRDPAGKVVTSADGYATGTSVTGVDAVAFAFLAEAGTYSGTGSTGTRRASPSRATRRVGTPAPKNAENQSAAPSRDEHGVYSVRRQMRS